MARWCGGARYAICASGFVYEYYISVVFSRPRALAPPRLRAALAVVLITSGIIAFVLIHLATHRLEPCLAGEHLGGVFALLALVADELDADGLHVVGRELVFVIYALGADAEIEGAQSVELDLVALQEQLLEAHHESLHHTLHHIGRVNRSSTTPFTTSGV